MAKKTNKTSHVLDLLTNGTSSEANGAPSRTTIPKKVTVVDKGSRDSQLAEDILHSLSEELGQEVPLDDDLHAETPSEQTHPVQTSETASVSAAAPAADGTAVSRNASAEQPAQDIPQSERIADLRTTFSNREEDDFHFLNVMEELLLQQDLDGLMKDHNVCTCRRCKADVCALALTALPSKYVVISRTSLSPVLNYYENKFKIAMLTELNKACAIVRETPHHSR